MKADRIRSGEVIVPDWLPGKALGDVDAVDGVRKRSRLPASLLPGHRAYGGAAERSRVVGNRAEPGTVGGIESAGEGKDAVCLRPFHRRDIKCRVARGIIDKHRGEDGAPALDELNAPSVLAGVPPQVALIVRPGGRPCRAHETQRDKQRYG